MSHFTSVFCPIYIYLVVSVVASHCLIFAWYSLTPRVIVTFWLVMLYLSFVLCKSCFSFTLVNKAVLLFYPVCGFDFLHVGDLDYYGEQGSIPASGHVS